MFTAMYHALQRAGLISDVDRARLHRQETIRKDNRRKFDNQRVETARRRGQRNYRQKLMAELRQILGERFAEMSNFYEEQPTDWLEEQVRVLKEAK